MIVNFKIDFLGMLWVFKNTHSFPILTFIWDVLLVPTISQIYQAKHSDTWIKFIHSFINDMNKNDVAYQKLY